MSSYLPLLFQYCRDSIGLSFVFEVLFENKSKLRCINALICQTDLICFLFELGPDLLRSDGKNVVFCGHKQLEFLLFDINASCFIHPPFFKASKLNSSLSFFIDWPWIP